MSASPPKNPHEHNDHWFVSALHACGYLAAALVLYEFQGAQRTGIAVAVVASCQLLIIQWRVLVRWLVRILKGIGSLFCWRSKSASGPPPLPTAPTPVSDVAQAAASNGTSMESSANAIPEAQLAQGNGHERRLASPPAPGATSGTKLAGRRNPPAVPMSKPKIESPTGIESPAGVESTVEDASQPSTLVECPDCGRQISRRAYSCPGCGAPMSVPPPLPNRATRINRRLIAGTSLLLAGVPTLFLSYAAASVVAGVGSLMIVWGLWRR